MIDYALILTNNFPGEVWTLDGEEYSGLTWLSDSTKPTKKQLDALWESTVNKIQGDKAAAAQAKQAILDRLGITEEEAKLILG